MVSKVLERSDKNRILAGVFGGLGEYLNVDPNLLRLVGVILLIVSPVVMVVVYSFAAFLIPRKGGVSYVSPTVDWTKLGPVVVGIALVAIGSTLLGGIPSFLFFPSLSAAFASLAGLAILVIGVALLLDQLRKI